MNDMVNGFKRVMRLKDKCGNRRFNLLLLEELQHCFCEIDLLVVMFEVFPFMELKDDFRKKMDELNDFLDYINDNPISPITTFENAIFQKMDEMIESYAKYLDEHKKTEQQARERRKSFSFFMGRHFKVVTLNQRINQRIKL